MRRISRLSIFLFLLLAGVRAQTQQDYVDQLIRLTGLTDNQQYREAINGYKRLESGAPDWLKAGSEYAIAELYAELNETDNAIAALESARLARATAESRKAEIRKRAFVPLATSSNVPKPCSEWR